MNIIYKNKELKFLKQLNEDVNELLKKESKSFLLRKVSLHNNIKLLCFTYPEQLANVLNLDWSFNNIKNFRFNEEIERLSKNNQKNIFFIYSKGSKAYSSFYIKGLYSSPIEENPLCFKNGEKFYLINYQGLIFASRKIPEVFVEELDNIVYFIN